MVISFLGSILALRLYFLGKPNLLNLANLALHVRMFFEQMRGEKDETTYRLTAPVFTG